MGLLFFMFALLNSYGILAFTKDSLHLPSNEDADIDMSDDQSNDRAGKRKYADFVRNEVRFTYIILNLSWWLTLNFFSTNYCSILIVLHHPIQK